MKTGVCHLIVCLPTTIPSNSFVYQAKQMSFLSGAHPRRFFYVLKILHILLFYFQRPPSEILKQPSHSFIRYPHVHGLIRILYAYIGAPDKLQQFGQRIIVIIKFQIRDVLLFGPLRQKVSAVHIKKAIAQIGYAGTVTVIVGGFCVAGEKPFQGGIVFA